eukprot:11326705-Alexandrium_andersonii.AAC.1
MKKGLGTPTSWAHARTAPRTSGRHSPRTWMPKSASAWSRRPATSRSTPRRGASAEDPARASR